MNAFILDKNYIKIINQGNSQSSNNNNSNSSNRKKFISVGDYEISKTENLENLNSFNNYGFFSNVLEDENKELKLKTIDLIYKICNNKDFKKFSKISYKYLLEMINDDEDDVRHKTMEILIELIKIFKYSDSESLLIIFFNLKEKSQLLRKYLYRIISNIHINDKSEFELVLEV